MLGIPSDPPPRKFTLRFPREPAYFTPTGTKCGICNWALPNNPAVHEKLPIQLPCGCVQHLGCIHLMFEMQAKNAFDNIVRLECANCGYMLEHLQLGYYEDINEPCVTSVFDERHQVMVLVVALIVAPPRGAGTDNGTCDPKDTLLDN